MKKNKKYKAGDVIWYQIPLKEVAELTDYQALINNHFLLSFKRAVKGLAIISEQSTWNPWDYDIVFANKLIVDRLEIGGCQIPESWVLEKVEI
jgi:hypothetical protein